MSAEALYHLNPLPPSVRTLAAHETDRLVSRDPNLPASPKQCVTCGGAKTFRWWKPDIKEPGMYECPCVDQWRLYYFLAWAGIGLAYQRFGWTDVSTDNDARVGAYEKLLDWADDPYTMIAGQNLILLGPNGTGKTLLSVLALKRLLAQGHDGFFTTFDNLVSELMATWSSSENRQWFHARIRNAGVLVIDDPGTELHKSGGGTHETPRFAFESVVRHRQFEGRPTVITSNLKSFEMLGQQYGKNLASLLADKTEVVHFDGGDWRSRAVSRLSEEKRHQLRRPIVI